MERDLKLALFVAFVVGGPLAGCVHSLGRLAGDPAFVPKPQPGQPIKDPFADMPCPPGCEGCVDPPPAPDGGGPERPAVRALLSLGGW